MLYRVFIIWKILFPNQWNLIYHEILSFYVTCSVSLMGGNLFNVLKYKKSSKNKLLNSLKERLFKVKVNKNQHQWINHHDKDLCPFMLIKSIYWSRTRWPYMMILSSLWKISSIIPSRFWWLNISLIHSIFHIFINIKRAMYKVYSEY